MIIIKFITRVVVVLILSGCHPKYSIDQTEYYARLVGVTNQFDIQRRNTRTLSVSSHLCVISEPQKDVDVDNLSEVIAKGLSGFFDKVCVAKSASSTRLAAKLARKKRADFMIYVRLQDTAVLLKNEAPTASTDYHRLQIMLEVVDANSEKVMDKIQLLAKSSHFSLVGKDMDALLKKPIEFIGRDLTGV